MQATYNTQMEKNDTRYDTFDFNIQFKKRTGILISETKYFLNKSKSKWISVGFSLERKYEVITTSYLGGIKNNQHVIFNEDQWISFLNNQGIMLSFVYSNKTGWQVMRGNGFQIHFVYMGAARIVKISQDGGNEVFLAAETISELSNLVNLVKYRYDMLKFQEFSKYYNILVSDVSLKSGDMMNNLYEIILP
ncbi:unnamed protein product [Ceutorhynchus assimilis]|uniref:Uncharacterized protein n=1 Tax=Ceutorhynchus assimilis TaxID=467358 RepID=A0A9N9MG94_9CUCU|nr:unnamed protein product [Ceutorhynchus assimilis]